MGDRISRKLLLRRVDLDSASAPISTNRPLVENDDDAVAAKRSQSGDHGGVAVLRPFDTWQTPAVRYLLGIVQIVAAQPSPVHGNVEVIVARPRGCRGLLDAVARVGAERILAESEY